MGETALATRRSAPWHLWVIGTALVLLGLGGATVGRSSDRDWPCSISGCSY